MTAKVVDKAGNEARSALLTAGLPGAAIPVLFMRIRNGQLLGFKGRLSSSTSDEDFWPYLIGRLAIGQVIPFLGSRVNSNLVSSSENIAQRLAARYKYPFENQQDIFKIAQFMAVRDPELMRLEYLKWLKRSLFFRPLKFAIT